MHGRLGFNIVDMPMSLMFFGLQLEVLGRSLFWDNIRKKIEFEPKSDSLTDTVVQHLNLATSSHGQQMVASQTTPATTSQSFDLLSGWEEPEVLPTASKHSNPFLDDDDLVQTATNPFLSWDPFAPSTSESTINALDGESHNENSQINVPQSKAKYDSAAAEYIEIVKSFFKSDPVCHSETSFLDIRYFHFSVWTI